MDTTIVGVDLAKRVISVCRLSAQGTVAARQDYRPDAFAAFLAQLPAGTIIGMEACSTAHYWARKAQALGLQPRLMAPEFVKAFRKRQSTKHDAADAEAIAIAVQQPTMRFVAIKTEVQQARLAWHRARSGWIEARTALINRLRGLLLEFGHAIANGSTHLRRDLALILDDERLPASLRQLLREAQLDLNQLDERIASADRAIRQSGLHDDAAQRLQALSGIGPLTADALCATVSTPAAFKHGRQFAAWLGLTPRQHSSGGKAKLGRISKAGDAYLRTLLIQGARSALQCALRQSPDTLTRLQRWMVDLRRRLGWHKTLVAIANKHARQLWVMLAKGEAYDADAWQRQAKVVRAA